MNSPTLMACLMAASAAAHAQLAPTPTTADPLQAQAPVPSAAASSPLANYRRHGAVVVQPGGWRAANETVTRVGGWRAYAREAQAPAAGTSTSTGAPAALATPAHKH